MQRFYCLCALVLFFLSSGLVLHADGEITGTVTAGSGGDYANIKLAFDAINTNGISGDVVINIISDQSLTAAAVLNAFDAEATLKIITSGDFTISANVVDSGTLVFNQCSKVSIDGSIEGTDGVRNLIIENTGESSTSSKYSGAVRLVGADGISIENTVLRGGTGAEQPDNQCGIVCHESDGVSKNITLSNNLFDRGEYGIYFKGLSSKIHENITITDNMFVARNNNEYLSYATYLYYCNNIKFNDNDIQGYIYDADDYKPMYALYSYYCAGTGEFNGNTISKAERGLYLSSAIFTEDVDVKNNNLQEIGEYGIYLSNSTSGPLKAFIADGNTIRKVDKLMATSSTGAALGIYLYAAPGSTISNNIITDIINNYNGTSSSPGYTAGIMLYGASGKLSDKTKIIHNTISNVVARGTDYVSTSMGAYWWYYPAGILVRDGNDIEILQNTIQMGQAFAHGGKQGVYSANILLGNYYAASAGHKIKNNVLVNNMTGNGTESFNIVTQNKTTESTYTVDIAESDYNALTTTGSIAKFAEDDATYAYLVDWQAAGFGQNSTDLQVSLTADGHLDGIAALSADLECPPIQDLNITTDLDGEERGTANTIMGTDIVNLTLELTQDLSVSPDKPEGLCDGTRNISFVFDAKGNFADGVERNIGDAMQVKWFRNNLPISENDENYEINGRRFKIIELSPELGGEYRAEFWAKNLPHISTASKTINVIEPVSIVSENMVEKYIGCEGFHDLTLSIETHNEFGVQWQKEIDGIWTDIEGANQKTFVLDFTKMTKVEADGKYRAKVTGDELCEPKYPSVLYTDTETEVELYLPITAEKMEYFFDAANLCGGMDLEFYAEAQGTVRGYQWQKHQGGQWYDITEQENPTAVTQNFKISNIDETNTGSYRCKVIGNAECYDLEVFTEDVFVNIPPQFELVGQPESQVICGGESVRFDVMGNGIGEIISYRWYKDNQPINTEDNEFADDASLMISNSNIGNIGEYYCKISIRDCRGEVEYKSESAILYVLQETKITRQPQSLQVIAGDKATLSVEAHMKGLIPPYYQHDFQWYKDGVALEDDNRIQGTRSSLLTIENVNSSDFSNEYYCVVTGKCGIDESVRVSISDAPTVNITAQPQSAVACENNNVTMSVSGESTDTTLSISYQWFLDGVALQDNIQINGSNTNTLNLSNLSLDLAGVYTVRLNLTNGAEVLSDEAELEIETKPIATFSSMLNLEEDETLKLEVNLQNPKGVSYQWYKNSVAIAGATNEIYEIDSVKLADAGEYYCEMTNNCGQTETDKANVTVVPKTNTGVFAQAGSGYELLGNEPNPFETSTTIKFNLSTAANVKVTLTDANGRKLAVIFDGQAVAGENRIDLDASAYNLSSGTYFYTVETEGAAAAKSMILVK